MDNPDAPGPTSRPAAGDVQAIVSTGSVGHLRCHDGGPAAPLPVLLLRHRLRAGRSRRRPPAQHHGHARRRRQRARRGRDWRFGILLASTRRIVRADKMIRRGDWTKRIPNRFGAIAGLTGGKVGILGPRRHRPGARQARQGLRRRDRLLQPQQAQRRRLRVFSRRHGARDLGRLPDRLPALGRLQQAHHQCRRAEGAGPARPSGQHQPRLGGRRGGPGRRAPQQRDRGCRARRVRRGALRRAPSFCRSTIW